MISVKPAHISRYASIGRLLLKYGHGALQQLVLDEPTAGLHRSLERSIFQLLKSFTAG